MAKKSYLQFPVISASAEYLVMGYLMRRNILTYKAPPNNEGYDLICIHPNPRRRRRPGQLDQVKVQVKSRYATDARREFPLKSRSRSAFDFVVAVFLNIGEFAGGKPGLAGRGEVEFYVFPRSVLGRISRTSGWEGIRFNPDAPWLQKYRGEAALGQIGKLLGVCPPRRK